MYACDPIHVLDRSLLTSALTSEQLDAGTPLLQHYR